MQCNFSVINFDNKKIVDENRFYIYTLLTPNGIITRDAAVTMLAVSIITDTPS